MPTDVQSKQRSTPTQPRARGHPRARKCPRRCVQARGRRAAFPLVPNAASAREATGELADRNASRGGRILVLDVDGVGSSARMPDAECAGESAPLAANALLPVRARSIAACSSPRSSAHHQALVPLCTDIVAVPVQSSGLSSGTLSMPRTLADGRARDRGDGRRRARRTARIRPRRRS
jgi:hypothetical protein